MPVDCYLIFIQSSDRIHVAKGFFTANQQLFAAAFLNRRKSVLGS